MSDKTLENVLVISLFTTSFLLSVHSSTEIIRIGELVTVQPVIRMLSTGEIISNLGTQHAHLGSSILFIPFAEIGGNNILTFRVFQAFFLALTVVSTYLYAREAFDRKTAIISALLLLTFPYFILMKTNEIPLVAVYLPLYLFLYSRILKLKGREKTLYIYLLAFLLGFGFYQKLQMVYFAGVLLSYHFLVSRRDLFLGRGLNTILKASIFFLLGISPFILYNISSKWPILESLMKNFRKPSPNHNNFAVIKNLIIRLEQFKTALNIAPEKYVAERASVLALTYYSFIASALHSIAKGSKKEKGLVLGLILYTILICFVPNDKDVHHFHAVLPLVMTLIGRNLGKINNKNLAAIFTSVLLITNFSVTIDALNYVGNTKTEFRNCYRSGKLLDSKDIVFTNQNYRHCTYYSLDYFSSAELKDFSQLGLNDLQKVSKRKNTGFLLVGNKSLMEDKKTDILDRNKKGLEYESQRKNIDYFFIWQ